MGVFKEVWDYRQMINSLVKKDLATRYKGSILGFLWTFLNPLFQLVIYTLVFSVFLKFGQGERNFAMYLFVALIPWLFCQTSIVGGSMSVINAAGLVNKVYFPRLVLPIAAVTGNFVNMLLSFIAVIVALFVTGFGLTPYALFVPVFMILEYFFVLGIAILVSAVTVYIRDLEHILAIFTMAWFYLAPIIYTVGDITNEFYIGIIYGNPMTGILMGFRDALYYQRMPDFSLVLPAALYTVAFFVVGILAFQKLQRRFAEEL